MVSVEVVEMDEFFDFMLPPSVFTKVESVDVTLGAVGSVEDLRTGNCSVATVGLEGWLRESLRWGTFFRDIGPSESSLLGICCGCPDGGLVAEAVFESSLRFANL